MIARKAVLIDGDTFLVYPLAQSGVRGLVCESVHHRKDVEAQFLLASPDSGAILYLCADCLRERAETAPDCEDDGPARRANSAVI